MMKTIDHLAYHPNYNFPIHISSPDSVRDHLDDKIRLISMMPGEWPRLRCRDLRRENLEVEDTYSFTADGVEHKVEVVMARYPDIRGKLVDGKYFFTFGALASMSDLELMFSKFSELGVQPYVQSDWSMEYPSANIARYTLEEPGVGIPSGEKHFPFKGLDVHGIDTLADLLAYAYKFKWDPEREEFFAVTDQHEIARRLRKPWMQFLAQRFYGERATVESDHGKMISFLVAKVYNDLSVEEQEMLRPFKDASPEAWQLENMAQRMRVLNALNSAFLSKHPLVTGKDVDADPLFTFE